jgi:group I intron endonuclease
MIGGIYQIRNVVTAQVYIGRSVKAPARISQHFSMLRKGVHHNSHLQSSFKKYGDRAFVGSVLIVCSREMAPLYEYLIIKGLRSDDRKFGFNLTIATDEGKLTHAPETCAKIAEYNRTLKPKYVRTPEIRAKISKTLTGKPGANKGRIVPPEQRVKMSAAKRANWADPEYRAMMIAKNHSDGCLRLSDETTKKISASLKVFNANKQGDHNG